MEIPPEVLQTDSTLIIPLTDAEKEEEKEAEIYTIPFCGRSWNSKRTPCKIHPKKKKTIGKRGKGKKPVFSDVVPTDIDINWHEVF
jgi:hypothetical protein